MIDDLLNAENGTFLEDTLLVGDLPTSIAILPGANEEGQNLAYVTNSSEGTLAVIDLDQGDFGQVLPAEELIAAGDAPFDIAITPDGALAYIANSFRRQVTVIDLDSGAQAARIDVGSQPYSVAITPDGSRAYVADRLGNALYAIDIASQVLLGSLSTGTRPVSIVAAPDGERAYVANSSGNSINTILLEPWLPDLQAEAASE